MSDSYKGRRGSPMQAAAAVLAVLAVAAAVFLFLQVKSREPGALAAGSGGPSGSDEQPAGSNEQPAGSNEQPAGSGEPAGSADTSWEPGPVRQPASPEADKSTYDFSQPVPEREAVDNSYFQDAAFVGDSRTDGFMLYSGVGCGKNLTSNGLSIFKLAEKKALTIGGEEYTLLEALALEKYGKVYLSLGVNELGIHNDEKFYESYCAAIDQIRQVQPGAVIYIQGLIPLNEAQIEAFNGNKYNLTNDHLRVYNDLMRKAAEEKQVAYLDVYTEFADENGALPEDFSRDGVHLKKEPCRQWLEYLKTHTVDFDALYPDGPPAPEPAEPAEPVQPDASAADGSVQG